MKKFLIKIFLGFFIMIPTANSAEKWDLALRDEVNVSLKDVQFKDTVNRSETSPSLVERYGSVKIISQNGSYLKTADILLALGRAGLDLKSINLLTSVDHNIKSNHRYQIATLLEEKIREKVKKENSSLENIQIKLTKIPLKLPSQEKYYEITVDPLDSASDLSGFSRYLVKFLDQSGIIVETEIAEAEVKFLKKVIVAKRSLIAGEIVTKDDFVEEKRSLDNLTHIVTDLSELGSTQWVLKNSLDQGEILKKSFLNLSAKMEKGSMVTLITGTKGFQVRTLGRIKDVFEDGNTVLVVNVDSNKELVGRLLNMSEVEVIY